MMRAYSDVYLGDVVENQGKLFDYVANTSIQIRTQKTLSMHI